MRSSTLQPVKAGEHQVQHHQGRAQAPARLDPVGPGVGDLDTEPLAAKAGRHGGGDRGLVLDDQHSPWMHGAEHRHARSRIGMHLVEIVWRFPSAAGA